MFHFVFFVPYKMKFLYKHINTFRISTAKWACNGPNNYLLTLYDNIIIQTQYRDMRNIFFKAKQTWAVIYLTFFFWVLHIFGIHLSKNRNYRYEVNFCDLLYVHVGPKIAKLCDLCTKHMEMYVCTRRLVFPRMYAL